MQLKMHILKETIEESIKDAMEEEWYDDIEDGLHEIIDSHMPIYTYEILQYALDEPGLAIEEPEIYAFDGKHNAVNAILGNIYEDQYAAAVLTYAALKKEKENDNK